MKPHVEQVTCRKPSAKMAEARALVYARQLHRVVGVTIARARKLVGFSHRGITVRCRCTGARATSGSPDPAPQAPKLTARSRRHLLHAEDARRLRDPQDVTRLTMPRAVD